MKSRIRQQTHGSSNYYKPKVKQRVPLTEDKRNHEELFFQSLDRTLPGQGTFLSTPLLPQISQAVSFSSTHPLHRLPNLPHNKSTRFDSAQSDSSRWNETFSKDFRPAHSPPPRHSSFSYLKPTQASAQRVQSAKSERNSEFSNESIRNKVKGLVNDQVAVGNMISRVRAAIKNRFGLFSSAYRFLVQASNSPDSAAAHLLSSEIANTKLSYQQMKQGLNRLQLGLTSNELDALIVAADPDSSGSIQMGSFADFVEKTSNPFASTSKIPRPVTISMHQTSETLETLRHSKKPHRVFLDSPSAPFILDSRPRSAQAADIARANKQKIMKDSITSLVQQTEPSSPLHLSEQARFDRSIQAVTAVCQWDADMKRIRAEAKLQRIRENQARIVEFTRSQPDWWEEQQKKRVVKAKADQGWLQRVREHNYDLKRLRLGSDDV